jgi:hypothetical protein
LENNSLLQLGGANGNSLNIYSLADPTKPAMVSSVTLPSLFVNSIVPAGNVVYFTTDWYSLAGAVITGQYGEFYSYDFTNPKTPLFRSQLLTDPGTPGSNDLSPRWKAALIDANTAVISSTTASGGNTGNGKGLLQIADISSPGVIKVVDTLAIPGTAVATGVAVQNGIALVVGNTAGWSNPAAPGQSAVFGGNLTISAVDVSSPQKPALKSTLTPSPAVQSSGTYSVVGIGNGRFAVAVGAPAVTLPATTGNATAPPAPGAAGFIEIVDASNPTALTFAPLATVLMPGELAFSNGLLLAPGANGLNIFQVN